MKIKRLFSAHAGIVAGLIIFLALILRLRGLDTTGLWGDQAFTLNTAMRWVNGGALPLAANKSSVGFVNPPMIEYLYAAALFLWRDILSVSLLTLLGGLLAVAATGYVTARLFGRRAGWWAMLAFAVAPWAVFWSQLIWNQTMVPPFAALALGGLLLYLAYRPRPAYLIGSFAAAAAMTQVHPGSAVQLLTMALALIIFRRRARARDVLAGAAVFALLYQPYLLYQIGSGWADFRAIGGVAGQAATWSSAALGLSLDLIRAQGLYRAVPLTRAFDALAAAVFIGALGWVAWRLGAGWAGERPPAGGRRDAPPRAAAGQQRADTTALSIILLWFLMPLLFYLRSSVYLQNYYLVGQWPAHFMILGIGLDTAQRAAERLAVRGSSTGSGRGWAFVSRILPLPLLALAVFQIIFSRQYQDARAAGDGPAMQVRHARAMIALSRELLESHEGRRLVGLGHGPQVESSDLALLREFVDPAGTILADSDLALPLPRPYGIHLDTRPGSLASYVIADQGDPIPEATIQVKDQTWQFYQWAEPDATTGAPPLARWDMGLDLAGYFPGDLIPGQETIVVLTWDVTNAPDDLYHFGVYVLDEQGNVVAQHDGPGFDSVQWRAGDRFLTFHRLQLPADLPAGTYRTAVALYTWPGLVRAELAGGGDTAYLAEVELPAP